MTGGDERNPKKPSEFQQAMADATPLEERDKLRPAPKTIRRRRRRPDAEGADAPAFEIERLGERIEGSAPGTDPGVLRRLRNGEIPRDVRLDLHGLTAEGARRRVREALERMRASGERCALVIHGRGRRSEDAPVLKDALPEWLAEPPLAGWVLAFASAAGRDGGVGATYVLLRRERSD